MTEAPIEYIPTEFRHDIVTKFIMGLSSGAIKMKLPGDTNMDKTGVSNLSGMYVTFLGNVTKYCSGKYRNQELDLIELELFDKITFFRTIGVVMDNPIVNQDIINENIKRLEKRIDSTYRLLEQIMKLITGESPNDK